MRTATLLDGGAGLTALLLAQAFISFVVVPVMATGAAGPWLLDAGHVVFALICVTALARRRIVQSLLIGLVAIAAAGPLLLGHLGVPEAFRREALSLVAFVFNLLVTALVGHRIFADGHVTRHRLRGAIVVYLNTAALFSIAYDVLDMIVGAAILPTTGGALPEGPGVRIAALSYFSLATITTTGYGDLAPIHPIARSLANLEAVFGQLFPATVVARLVALRLAHSEAAKRERAREHSATSS